MRTINNLEEKIKKENQENVFLSTTQGKRFLNYILDLIFLYIFSLVLWEILWIISSDLVRLTTDMNEYLVGVVVGTIFYATCESIWSKTPAKFITKTKVITEKGEKPELSNIIRRTLIRFIPLEPFSFLSSDRPKGWHDRWSKTMVVDDETIKERERNKKGNFINEGKQETQANQNKEISYCIQCGNKIRKDVIFCSKCGSKIN
jgi:uncharacterized RDD family membrane protein YckC